MFRPDPFDLCRRFTLTAVVLSLTLITMEASEARRVRVAAISIVPQKLDLTGNTARIPALEGAQFLVIPAYGSTSRAQDAAVLDRARETGLPIVEANVGVSLIVSGGEIASLRREKTAITFGEIEVPPARTADDNERDRVEREFLRWRAGEMQRRFEAKRHRLGTADLPIAAAKN